MTGHKFTDDDLEKTLHICSHYAGNCSDYCPLRNDDECVQTMARNALARINRQKAEIEEKSKNITFAAKELIRLDRERSEVIKEFAERLKSHLIIYTYINLNDAIDTLVKEMTEENHESKST